jgi:CRISPR-associated endoribonuclease Cas6
MNVCNFQLHIEPRQPIILPPYKGSTLRGGFGNAFKKIVCTFRDKNCADCLLREQCVYSYIFETPPPTGTKVMRKYKAVPHPFIIEPPPERKASYKPGEALTFGLTLIGKAIDFLPYFVYTFDELGNMGIGKGRGKYELKEVKHASLNGNGAGQHRAGGEVAGESLIYSSATRKLSPFSVDDLAIKVDSFPNEDKADERITIRFLTPTRILSNGRLTSDIEFHILIRQLLRRISMLSYFHCAVDTSAWNFKGYIDKALKVKAPRANLRWHDWERYSARQEQRINMGGFIGEIAYEGAIGPFLPLLKAGEILHVGKGTSFGLGKYEILC